jgi:hypothetical protein
MILHLLVSRLKQFLAVLFLLDYTMFPYFICKFLRDSFLFLNGLGELVC